MVPIPPAPRCTMEMLPDAGVQVVHHMRRQCWAIALEVLTSRARAEKTS
jgi:hypothetical protein